MEQSSRTQKSSQIDLPLQNSSQRTGYPEDLYIATSNQRPTDQDEDTTSSSNFTIPTWTHSQTHSFHGLSKTGTNYPNPPLIKPPRPPSNRAFPPLSFNFPCDHHLWWPPTSCENFHEKSYGGETTKYQVPKFAYNKGSYQDRADFAMLATRN